MKTNRSQRGFSLIELSIVILIIGILIAGITQSTRILSQAKLNTARTLTQSSPVSSIRDLSLWIDSTSEDSFNDNETDDNLSITKWFDINPQVATGKSDFTGSGSNRPEYDQNIQNGLPMVLFESSESDNMKTANFTNINAESTIFLVAKPVAQANQVIFSKRVDSDGGAPNIQLSTTSSGHWQYCDAAGTTTGNITCNYASSTTAYSADTAYVVSIVYNPNSTSTASNTSTGIAFFLNGAANGKVTTTSSPSSSPTTDFTIGATSQSTPLGYFNGHIGELIIFDRKLSREERQSVEAYLGKKWNISMTVASY